MLTKRGRQRGIRLVWLRTVGWLLIVGSGLLAVQAIVLPTQWELVFGRKQWRVTTRLSSSFSPQLYYVVFIEGKTSYRLDTPFYHRLYGGTQWNRRWMIVGVTGKQVILPRIKFTYYAGPLWSMYCRIEIPYLFLLVMGLAMLWLHRRLKRRQLGGFPIAAAGDTNRENGTGAARPDSDPPPTRP